jgi:hypothetical protein
MLILHNSEQILLNDLISGQIYGCNKSAAVSHFQICYMLRCVPKGWKHYSLEIHLFSVYFLGLPSVSGWSLNISEKYTAVIFQIQP